MTIDSTELEWSSKELNIVEWPDELPLCQLIVFIVETSMNTFWQRVVTLGQKTHLLWEDVTLHSRETSLSQDT